MPPTDEAPGQYDEVQAKQHPKREGPAAVRVEPGALVPVLVPVLSLIHICFTGVVEEIEPEKNRVSVMVSMFGRETPVELELDQVEVQD